MLLIKSDQLKCEQVNCHYEYYYILQYFSNVKIFSSREKYLDQFKVGKYLLLDTKLKCPYFRYISTLHLQNLILPVGYCRRQLTFGFVVSVTLEYQPEDNGAYSLVTCHVFICSATDIISVPTQVEFLFRVLLGIGVLFRVVTPYNSSVPLRITSRSCEGKTQNHGSTCLLRITMSFKFCLVLLLWLSVIGLNYVEYQKISTQYKLLYHQPGIAEMFYSV